MSEQNKAPRWEDVPAAGKAFVRLRLRDAHDEVGPMDSAYDLVREAIDAALARLAEPAQSSAVAYARVEPASMRQCGCVPPRLCPSCGLPRPESSAAERWRAVPAEQRGDVLAWLSGAREAFVEEHAEASVDDVRECRDRLRAIDALLALAREAEGDE